MEGARLFSPPEKPRLAERALEFLMSDIYIDRTFLVGAYPVRVVQKDDDIWIAEVNIPYREGAGADRHLTLGTGDSALNAVVSLRDRVSDKAHVILHLSPRGEDGSITPLYFELTDFSKLLHSFAWGTVLGWANGVDAHEGHPSFEEVTQADAA